MAITSSTVRRTKIQFDQTTRRRFIILLGCAGATASLLAGCTQQTVIPGIDFKDATTPNDVVTDSLLQQAKVLGAPMAAVERAIQISRQPIFPKKDALAVSGGASELSPGDKMNDARGQGGR